MREWIECVEVDPDADPEESISDVDQGNEYLSYPNQGQSLSGFRHA